MTTCESNRRIQQRVAAFDPAALDKEFPAFAKYCRFLAQATCGEALARGAASQHCDLPAEVTRARCKIDDGPQPRIGAIEHDCFLRQPLHRCAAAEVPAALPHVRLMRV